MLSAIREIGSWQRDVKKADELATLIQEPFQKGRVALIQVNLDQGSYDGVVLEDYDTAEIRRYLFRRGPSNGPNPMPVAIITTIEKTFPQKILGWFKKYKARYTDSDLLIKIENVLTQNQEEIVKDINKTIKNIDKKAKRLLTIKIKKDTHWHYLGDLEVFPELLKKIVVSKTGEVSEYDQICSVCGERKWVSGDPGVFKFYTIDKPGFIAGGFDEASAWKNFPLCYDCKLGIEEGRRFIEENLSFKFYGLNYLLIPRLILSTRTHPEIMEILLDSKKVVSLKEQVKKTITNDEREILEIIAREKDVLTVNFLFLEKERGAERILLLIEDIFPSRIREIFDAKDWVDNIFKNKDEGGFDFGKVRTFFAKSSEGKKDYDLNKYFLEIVDSVFKGGEINFFFLAKFYMAVIGKEFIKEGYFKQRVNDALMGVMFFKRLGLLSFKEVKDMAESIFEGVFKRFAGVFGNPAARGVFLLGALTQLLLNKQWIEREATPFRKCLKGLRMRERDFRALLPKVQNKLEEYDSFDKGKRQIAAEAARYLCEAGEDWKIPTDKLNFYFVCGMNLADDVASVVYRKTEEKEE